MVLSNNALATLPPSICGCSELADLQVAENKLTSVPSGCAWPPALATLFLQARLKPREPTTRTDHVNRPREPTTRTDHANRPRVPTTRT